MGISKFFFNTVVYLALVIGFSSCADEITTIDDFNAPQNTQLSKFSEIQNNIFTPTCALSGCHGGNSPQANLNLSAGMAYSNLVNVTSVLFPNSKRIVPGNAAQSVLYKAVNYEPGFPLHMPPGGKLDQNLIDSIAVWINKGAPND